MTNAINCADSGEALGASTSLPAGDRSPCPACGSTRRSYRESVGFARDMSAHFAMLGKREGSSFTFDESCRPDGRTTSAHRNDDSTFAFSISGSAPQGEEQSLYACKLLVKRLNALGSSWDEPLLVDGSIVDCKAEDSADSDHVLQVQIVRAITDQDLWRTLNTQGQVQQSSVDISRLVSHLQKTIRKKEEKIALTARFDLTLALDATLLPAVAFDPVAQAFHRQHGGWARSLGFEAIWLVGPMDELVQRLDESS